MPANKELICLECPLACRLELTLDDQGAILECAGGQCKRGLTYAKRELKGSTRILTTTVLTEGSRLPLLAVRSDRPLATESLRQAVQSLACLKVRPPVRMGQVLVSDLLGSGASIIAADDLSE